MDAIRPFGGGGGALADSMVCDCQRQRNTSTGTSLRVLLTHPSHECTLFMKTDGCRWFILKQTTLAKEGTAFILAAAASLCKSSTERGFGSFTVRQRAETCAAVLFTGEARELRNGEARSPRPCSAATADAVRVGTNMCVAAFFPPLECSSRPGATCGTLQTQRPPSRAPGASACRIPH